MAPRTSKALHLILIALLTFTASTAFATAALAEKWIHIKVEEENDDTKVSVNLPMSLITAAMAMIPDEVRTDVDREVRIALDETPFHWDDLRTFWNELKKAPEATFVTVETRDQTVEVKKEGNYVLIKTTEINSSRGTKVDVKFPLAVVDGLFSGPEGTLNFEAALNALAEEGDGHIVSVQDDRTNVRIWIDEQNESE